MVASLFGAPRYRNAYNVFIFRHLLRGSEELDIARETCLPESELDADKTESRAAKAGPSLSRGVSENVAMDFSRLVKSSLQAVNLDREARSLPVAAPTLGTRIGLRFVLSFLS